MKKVFATTMFGTPFPWIQNYIDNVQHLEKYGWYWKIFTPAQIESKGNVEIVPMTTDQFNELVYEKLGVVSSMGITDKGFPSVHVTDYYVASGLIFEDYLKDADFWGITNLDVVYGRLDKFIPDSLLEDCDVFTDDVNVVNGVFSLWRNNEKVNNLFKKIPDWKMMLSQPPCIKCTNGIGNKHEIYGTDELWMTEVMKMPEVLKEVRYKYPTYSPMLSHDRLENHVPNIKLQIMKNGSLWEILRDTNSPEWIHARPYIGREIPLFHFIKTKQWPKCLL